MRILCFCRLLRPIFLFNNFRSSSSSSTTPILPSLLSLPQQHTPRQTQHVFPARLLMAQRSHRDQVCRRRTPRHPRRPRICKIKQGSIFSRRTGSLEGKRTHISSSAPISVLTTASFSDGRPQKSRGCARLSWHRPPFLPSVHPPTLHFHILRCRSSDRPRILQLRPRLGPMHPASQPVHSARAAHPPPRGRPLQGRHSLL